MLSAISRKSQKSAIQALTDAQDDVYYIFFVDNATKLDEKFAKLMVDFEVTVAERIDITYANGDKFVHGGSGVIGVYNDDQKSAISKLKETIAIDDETCYMFMVKNCIAKKADDSNDIVSGYMPRGYQFGFIYNELTNSRTIAHELSHGAFHLKHTFAEGDDYIAPERSTDNLMDYAGGETLNHWQWQDVHLPKSVRFKWLQDEKDAESIVLSFYDKEDKKKYLEIINGLRLITIFDKIYTDIDNSSEIFKVIDKKVSSSNVQQIIEASKHIGRNGEFIQAHDIVDTWTFLWLFDLFTLETKAGEEGNEHRIEFSSPKNQEIVNQYIKDEGKKVFANGLTYNTVFEEFFHAAHYLYYNSENVNSPSNMFTQTETEVMYMRIFVYYYLKKKVDSNIENYGNFDHFNLLNSDIGVDLKQEFDRIINNQALDLDQHVKILNTIIKTKKKNKSYNAMDATLLDYDVPFSKYLLKQLIK